MSRYRITVLEGVYPDLSLEQAEEKIRGLLLIHALGFHVDYAPDPKPAPPPDPVPDADGDFKCQDCGHFFASGKALGGHRSKAHRTVTP